MTASISIKEGSLLVDMEGADQFWALKSQLQIPVDHVTGAASAESDARKWLHEVQLGGKHVRGVMSAGRLYTQSRWVFWDVHDAASAIGIELCGERYSKLVVEVDNPDERIRQIQEVCASSEGGRSAHREPQSSRVSRGGHHEQINLARR
jgi:hypothetical protein